jgi:hypothetical protein
MLLGLGGLAVAGSVVLALTASRVGELPDAHLLWTAVCDPDLPGFYVHHELCKPLRHFKVAHPKRNITRPGRGLNKNLHS